jgi:hypothetical protein
MANKSNKCSISLTIKEMQIKTILIPSHLSENSYYQENKTAGGITLTVQYLPSKYEALSSNPSTTKKN